MRSSPGTMPHTGQGSPLTPPSSPHAWPPCRARAEPRHKPTNPRLSPPRMRPLCGRLGASSRCPEGVIGTRSGKPALSSVRRHRDPTPSRGLPLIRRRIQEHRVAELPQTFSLDAGFVHGPPELLKVAAVVLEPYLLEKPEPDPAQAQHVVEDDLSSGAPLRRRLRNVTPG